jgi:hypothetical protein
MHTAAACLVKLILIGTNVKYIYPDAAIPPGGGHRSTPDFLL